MNKHLGGICDAFSVLLPFTTEDRQRIINNFDHFSEQFVDQEVNYLRTSLKYILDEIEKVAPQVEGLYPGVFSQETAQDDGEETQGTKDTKDQNHKGKRQRLPVAAGPK